jgi:A/G-specific adenine glycosylase
MLNEAKHLLEKDAAQFRRCLARWYRSNRRNLPWRRTRDPYAILISEVMLQQTQVSAVIPYYERWLRRFPNIETLALASESEVLHVWQGLGYYSRARNLLAAAKILRAKCRGRFPRHPQELAKLPGVGRYTANAIPTFAFNRCLPVVETNIGRVLSRLFDLQLPVDDSAGRNELWRIAAQLLPRRDARLHNSALMDLGAVVCTRDPKCSACPVRRFCRAKNPSLLPIKKSPPRRRRLRELHSFNFLRDRVLLERSRRRWHGLWILPALATAPKGRSPVQISEFPFTHHRITLAVFAVAPPRRARKSGRWFPIRKIHTVPMPSPHRRALDRLLESQRAST